ncbi:S26 family signal peptidase [Modestobacter sp. Leaf380]|nr:S26 family signal peptidase [Modestobacter sp. Leaf380]KQS73807.1 S26 family signal peptidase [Modestobacter sp. Leaf380]
MQGLPRRWTHVRVTGPSMSPTLKDGDRLLVARADRARPGEVVIARFPARPELLVVKRCVREVPGGWWVEGDSAVVHSDSRTFGPAVVVGRVLARVYPRPGRLPAAPATGL